MTRVKVCGLAREEDARQAAELGADFLGLVLADSPRGVVAREVAEWIDSVREPFPRPKWVGVFVRPTERELHAAADLLQLDYVQIHGLRADEPPPKLPRPYIRVLRPDTAATRAHAHPSNPYAVLVDTPGPRCYGGTGRSFDWTEIEPARSGERLFLAGGLDASNVRAAIQQVQPWAVDASSRLEVSPGVKDPTRVEAFLAAVREGDHGRPAKDDRAETENP